MNLWINNIILAAWISKYLFMLLYIPPQHLNSSIKYICWCVWAHCPNTWPRFSQAFAVRHLCLLFALHHVLTSAYSNWEEIFLFSIYSKSAQVQPKTTYPLWLSVARSNVLFFGLSSSPFIQASSEKFIFLFWDSSRASDATPTSQLRRGFADIMKTRQYHLQLLV